MGVGAVVPGGDVDADEGDYADAESLLKRVSRVSVLGDSAMRTNVPTLFLVQTCRSTLFSSLWPFANPKAQALAALPQSRP